MEVSKVLEYVQVIMIEVETLHLEEGQDWRLLAGFAHWPAAGSRAPQWNKAPGTARVGQLFTGCSTCSATRTAKLQCHVNQCCSCLSPPTGLPLPSSFKLAKDHQRTPTPSQTFSQLPLLGVSKSQAQYNISPRGPPARNGRRSKGREASRCPQASKQLSFTIARRKPSSSADTLKAAELAAKKNKKKGAKKGTSSKEEDTADATPATETIETEAPPTDAKGTDEAVEESKEESKAAASEEETGDAPPSPSQAHSTLAQQSKLRSASFRQGSISAGTSGPMSPGPFSPGGDGETATDIYRKHVARIEELEKEKKRLAAESSDAEKRWKKAEDELADLREGGGDDGESKPAVDSRIDHLVSSFM